MQIPNSGPERAAWEVEQHNKRMVEVHDGFVPRDICPRCGQHAKWKYFGGLMSDRRIMIKSICMDCGSVCMAKQQDIPDMRVHLENSWEQTVLNQHHGQCQICGRSEGLHVKRIIPSCVNPSLTYRPSNSICLCEDCFNQLMLMHQQHPAT